MRALWAMALGLVACATPAPRRPAASPKPEPVIVAPPPPAAFDEARAVRDVVVRFLDAAEAGKFAEVLPLLAEPVRSRYSPERLAADFGAEPTAKSRLARVRAALPNQLEVRLGVALLPLDTGRHLRAVRETDGWRIAALEE
ncbi:MAG: hypothetical protein AB1730_02655 [Myxococcota bacterium]|jgi:hypothetical protein